MRAEPGETRTAAPATRDAPPGATESEAGTAVSGAGTGINGAGRATSEAGTALPVAGALVIAAAGGGFLAAQSRLNAQLGADVGQPLIAALVSNGIGVTIGLIAVACSARVRAGVLRLRGSGLRWWEYAGGLCGASLVAGAVIVVPHLGVALFTVGLVAGQTGGGLLCDRFGLAPGGRRPITAPRVAGAAIAIAAVAVADLLGGDAHVSVPYLLLSALLGIASALQGALNGRLRRATVEPLASVTVNGLVGTAGLLVALAIVAAVHGVRVDMWPGSWWEYAGGPMGVLIVFSAVFTVRSLGVLRLALMTIAGQLTTAVVLDQVTPAHGRGLTAGTATGVLLTFVAVAVAGYTRRRRPGGDTAPTAPDAVPVRRVPAFGVPARGAPTRGVPVRGRDPGESGP